MHDSPASRFTQMTKFIVTALLVVFWPLDVFAQTPRLEPRKPVEREWKGGETETYAIQADKGQFLHVIVEQKGIDVVVSLDGPDGQTITESDSPNGAFGLEPLSALLRSPVNTTCTFDLQMRRLSAERL